MSKESENFEKIIYRIHMLIEQPGSAVTWNDKIPDPDNPDQTRQIDITIKRDGKITHVECRIHGAKQDVNWIEELIGRRQSLNADALIAVSASGFTSGAIAKAKKYGIILRDFSSLSEKEVRNWGHITRAWITFFQYGFTSILFKIDMEKSEITNPDAILSFVIQKNLVDKVFDLVRKFLDQKNFEDAPIKKAKVRYKFKLDESNFESVVFDEVIFESQVKMLSQDFETLSVFVYDDPITPLDKKVFVEKMNMGNSEIAQASDHVSAVVDLTALDIPINTQFNSIRYNFVDPVCFESISILGLKDLVMPMDEIKIGIEAYSGL